MREATGWGYEMVKHDYSTYDLLGQWGFEMGPQPTLPGWSLHDRSRTNAEVIAASMRCCATRPGEQILLDGCNTVGHLGQGIFDLQRTGDDTSGRQWERTRRMGVNTLAFRLPQHGTFYTLDADLVGITEAFRGSSTGSGSKCWRTAEQQRSFPRARRRGERSNARHYVRPSRSRRPAALARGRSIGWRPAPLSVGRQKRTEAVALSLERDGRRIRIFESVVVSAWTGTPRTQRHFCS